MSDKCIIIFDSTPETEFDIDLKVGGQHTITRKEGDITLVMTGKFLEIEQPNKLVYTCAMPDFSPISDIISVDIQPVGKSASPLIFIQAGEGIDEELKQLPVGTRSESEKGWNLGFDLMTQAWKQTEN